MIAIFIAVLSPCRSARHERQLEWLVEKYRSRVTAASDFFRMASDLATLQESVDIALSLRLIDVRIAVAFGSGQTIRN
jgi:hypothetical protein